MTLVKFKYTLIYNSEKKFLFRPDILVLLEKAGPFLEAVEAVASRLHRACRPSEANGNLFKKNEGFGIKKS